MGVVDAVGWQVVVAAIAAVVLVAIGSVGGFRSAVATVQKPLAVASVGSPVEVPPWQIELESARQFDSAPQIARQTDGVRYLAVTLYLTNTASRFVPSGAAQPAVEALRIDAAGLRDVRGPLAPEDARPTLYRLPDAVPVGAFQPGIRYRVVAVWQQDAATPAPASLRITLRGSVYRASSLDGSMMWFPDDPVASGELPVVVGPP